MSPKKTAETRASARTVRLRIRRQDGPAQPETARWEEFELELTSGMTVASALEAIRDKPLAVTGVEVAPVAWECGCLEQACGSCAMLVNGQAVLACAVSLAELASRRRPVELAPLRKFPVVRDLVVDRSRISKDRAAAETWIDGAAREPLPPLSPELHQERMRLAACLECGACLEACPEYGPHTDYVGASVINRVALANLHPLGALSAGRRLELLMRPGGIADCGQVENCVEVCPARIPLVDSLQRVARATSSRLVKHWLFG
jgi:succinate dehydrogenase / fumarate reductase, iron-sulfur subunit